MGKHHRIDSSRACRGDTVDNESFLFEQAIEHTPGQRAVTASVLKCQVDRFEPDVLRRWGEGPDIGRQSERECMRSVHLQSPLSWLGSAVKCCSSFPVISWILPIASLAFALWNIASS